MPVPTSVDEFLDLVRRSGVLDEPKLTGYLQKLNQKSGSPEELAGLLVRDGLLTHFQAEQFLAGRWKRFSIGKYKVLEKLGSGGMGQVFLCEHKLMRRRVAVKVLPISKANDPSSLQRFYREARAVAALDHPNIVRAYDIDNDDNLHFLVMEYVDGTSLQDIIRKTGPMDPTRACHYMYWSAIGLQHAHTNGLLHRDVKPGNILVDRQGVVKILDLGLARFFNDEEDLLTRKFDETVLGTADYLAPEQAVDSHEVDGRADIYSLGATFYYLMTGNPPFAEGTVAQKLLWHQTRNPKPVAEFRPAAPPAVVAIIERMMAKKPDDRYPTFVEVAEALMPFTQTPIGPPPAEEMPQLSAAAQAVQPGPGSITSGGTGGGSRTLATSVVPVPAPSTGPRIPPVKPARTNPVPTPAPVAVADAETRRTAPIPVVEPIPDSAPGGPNWAALSDGTGETAAATSAKADTDRKRKETPSTQKAKLKKTGASTPPAKGAGDKKPTARRERRLSLILLVCGSLILIIFTCLLVYTFRGGPKVSPTAPNVTPETRTIVLTKNPGEAPLHFATLGEAVAKLQAGDRIEIADPEWEEAAIISTVKNVTIGPAPGKRVIWKAPPATKPATAVLTVNRAEGVRISGITFQAGDRAESALRLSGACPGLTVDDVELVGGTVASLAIHECSGERAKPVLVRKCWITSAGTAGKAGVQFTVGDVTNPKPNVPTPVNQEIHLLQCTVEGPFAGPAFVLAGSTSNVSVRHCRIWKAQNGLLISKPRPECVYRAEFARNTFHSLTGPAVRVENVAEMVKRPDHGIRMVQNLFINVPLLAQADGGDPANQKFLVSEGNVAKTGTPAGAPILPVTPTDADVAGNPADRSRFLLYDRSSPLAHASAGKPVGAGLD